MNPQLFNAAVAEFNEVFADRMDANATRFSPTLIFGMMQRARAEGRADIADKFIAACEQDDETPAHQLYHNQSVPGGTPATAGATPALPCTYLVKPDGASAQTECGGAATHRNGRMFYCPAHAEAASRHVSLIEISTGKIQPQHKRLF